MPAFDEHKDELEHYETMMGPQRGRLAVTLDLLTNALVLVGQHGVYCHTNRDPDVPVMDIRMIQSEISKAKELIQSVMEAMRIFRGTVKELAKEDWPKLRAEDLRRFAVETLERHLERRLVSARALGRI